MSKNTTASSWIGNVYEFGVAYELADGTTLDVYRELTVWDAVRVEGTAFDVELLVTGLRTGPAWITVDHAGGFALGSAIRGRVLGFVREHKPNDPECNSVASMSAEYAKTAVRS